MLEEATKNKPKVFVKMNKGSEYDDTSDNESELFETTTYPRLLLDGGDSFSSMAASSVRRRSSFHFHNNIDNNKASKEHQQCFQEVEEEQEKGEQKQKQDKEASQQQHRCTPGKHVCAPKRRWKSCGSIVELNWLCENDKRKISNKDTNDEIMHAECNSLLSNLQDTRQTTHQDEEDHSQLKLTIATQSPKKGLFLKHGPTRSSTSSPLYKRRNRSLSGSLRIACSRGVENREDLRKESWSPAQLESLFEAASCMNMEEAARLNDPTYIEENTSSHTEIPPLFRHSFKQTSTSSLRSEATSTTTSSRTSVTSVTSIGFMDFSPIPSEPHI
eukprot:m.78791 g.78791  ORF g.78791 m.78791 type:complete len:330 (+) comp11969_c0_seq1:493-1482(+)